MMTLGESCPPALVALLWRTDCLDGINESQEVAMLVTKVKAINQWMQCDSCKLQQVKSITPRKPEDRMCVHCRGTYLKEIRIYSN